MLDRGRNGYAVTLFGYEEPELLLRLEWHGAWLADAVAARVLPNLRQLLLAMAEAPDQPCHRLDGLDPAERERLLVEWNRTEVVYPRGDTLHGLVEAQVERTPDRAAVRFEGQALSYRELDRRANGVAAALRDRGVGRGALVGVFLERSPELVVSLLAVVKAGKTQSYDDFLKSMGGK